MEYFCHFFHKIIVLFCHFYQTSISMGNWNQDSNPCLYNCSKSMHLTTLFTIGY